MDVPGNTTEKSPLEASMDGLDEFLQTRQQGNQTATVDPNLSLEAYQPLERTRLDDSMDQLDSFLEQKGIDTTPQQYGIRDILNLSDDPLAAMSRLNASQYMAKALGLDTAFVYQNLDTISREYWGRAEAPQRIVDIWETSYKAGQLSTELNELLYETWNGRGTPEITSRIQQIREELPDYQFIYESLPKKAISDAANMLPFMLKSMGKGMELGPYAALGATLGAGAALLLAPEVTLPALGAAGATGLIGGSVLAASKIAMATQFTTVPGLMLAFQGGSMYGSARYSKKVMAGALYEELGNAVDVNGNPMNLHPDIIRAAVEGIAGVEAAIEMMQIGDIPGIRQIMQELSGIAVKNAITKGLIHGAVGTFVKKWGGSIVSETGEELVQKIVDIIVQEMILELDARGKGIEHRVDIEDAISRLGETFASSVRGFAVIGFPGSLLETGWSAVQQRQGSRVKSKQAPSPQPHSAQTPADAAAEQQGAAPGPVKEAAAEPAQFSRVPVRTKTIAQNDDRTTASVYAGEKDYARISIDHEPGTVTITDISTQNPEARRAILENIYRDYEGMDIVWEPETREDAALKTAVQQNVTVSRDFISQARKVFNLTEERQVTALHGIVSEFARRKGMDLATYFDTYFTKDFLRTESAAQLNQGRSKGGTSFVREDMTVPINQISTTDQVKAFITATEKADFSTAVHEFFHVAERLTLDQAQKNALAKAVGKTWDKMTIGDMENLAYGFENYLETGKAPTAELKTLFQQIAEIMSRIFSRLRQNATLSPEMIEFYDSLVSNPETGAAIAEETAKKETAREPEAAGAALNQQEQDPVVSFVPEQREVPRQPSNDLQEIIRLNVEAREGNRSFVETLAKRYGVDFFARKALKHESEKGLARVHDKAMEYAIEEGSDVPLFERVVDIDGYTLQAKDLSTILNIAEELNAICIRGKNRMGGPGYRDMLFNVRAENGSVYEIQINHEEIVRAKDTYGHKIYDVERELKNKVKTGEIEQDITSVLNVIAEAMNKLYSDAFEAATRGDRWNASSFDISSYSSSILKELTANRLGDMLEPSTLNTLAELSTASTVPVGDLKNLNSSISSSTESILLPGPEVNDEEILFQDIYHGTPHIWEPEQGFPHGRPRLDKIGTGEGSAAYGWGWYSAEAAAVAKTYTPIDDAYDNKLLKMYERAEARQDYIAMEVLESAMMHETVSELENRFYTDEYDTAFQAAAKKIIAQIARLEEKTSIYKLDLPDGVIPKLLDFDKPLSEQSEYVKKTLKGIGLSEESESGESIYSTIAEAKGSAKAASEYLASIGIPGNQYFDKNSRDSGEGTHNYVIWDQDVLDRMALLERNGKKLEVIREAEILFQEIESNLIEEALNFETPEEFRQYIEAMYFDDEKTAEAEGLSEEDKAAWYRKVWTLARERNPGSVKGENLTKHVQQPGVLEQFLKKVNDAVSMRGFEGFAPEDAEDVQTYETAAKLQRDISAQVHPLILSNAIRAAKGKPLTESVRKAIITLISQAEPEYGRIFYQVTGDDTYLQPDAEALSAVDIAEPQFDELDRLSITDRYRLAARIKNEEIARKIVSGDIVVDTEVEEYIDSLNEKIGSLQKEVKAAREELAEDFTKFGKQEQTFIKQRDQIKEKTREVEKLNRQVQRLVEDGKEVKEKLSRTRLKAEQDLRDLKATFKDTMKSAREEARLQAYTKKEDAIKKLKAEIKRKQEEKKAAQEIREYKLKLAQAIMREPGKNVYIDYATQIEEIQRVIDPKFRSAQAVWQWELAGKLLAKGDTETFERIIPESIRKRLEKKPLNLWTIQELEELKSKIDALRDMGRLERSRIDFTTRLRRDDIANSLIYGTLKGHVLVPKSAIGSVEDKEAKKAGLGKKLDLDFLRPDRVLRTLDGGKEGVWYARIWRPVNRIIDFEITQVNDRRQRINDAMKELGIKVNDLSKKLTSGLVHEMQKDGTWEWVPRTYRVQDAMFFYVGMKNERTYAAIIHGMGLTEEFVNSMIAQLTPEQIRLTEIMSKELDIAWERLREALAKDKNLALGKEAYYVPMRRYEETGDNLAANLVDEALTRTAWYNAYPNKGFTKARIDIAPEHQKPIRTDFFNLVMSSIEQQEHYLASWEFVKDIQNVLDDSELQRAVNQEFGKEYNEWLQKYINNIANPNAGKDLTAMDKLFSTMQRNMGIAYLSYNLTTILKQAPSFLLAVGEVDPHHLAASAARFAANPAAMLKRVAEMDPQIKNRAIDPLFAKLKESEKGILAQVTGTFGRIGMKPIEWVDKAVVTIVWDAAYNHALREGKTLNQARDYAQDVINRTQPAGRVKDLPLAYSSGNPAYKMFLIFTNQVNQIWNMMRADIPFAVKAGNIKYITMKTTAMALSFLAMGAIGNRFEPPEDEKEYLGWILEGMVNAIPLVGKDIVNGIKGFDTGVTPVVPLEPAVTAAKKISSGNVGGALESAGEAVATGMGVPVTGIKRIARAIQDRDFRQILGGKRDKKRKKR